MAAVAYGGDRLQEILEKVTVQLGFHVAFEQSLWAWSQAGLLSTAALKLNWSQGECPWLKLWSAFFPCHCRFFQLWMMFVIAWKAIQVWRRFPEGTIYWIWECIVVWKKFMLTFAHLHRTHWKVSIVTTNIILISVFQSVKILSCKLFLPGCPHWGAREQIGTNWDKEKKTNRKIG